MVAVEDEEVMRLRACEKTADTGRRRFLFSVEARYTATSGVEVSFSFFPKMKRRSADDDDRLELRLSDDEVGVVEHDVESRSSGLAKLACRAVGVPITIIDCGRTVRGTAGRTKPSSS